MTILSAAEKSYLASRAQFPLPGEKQIANIAQEALDTAVHSVEQTAKEAIKVLNTDSVSYAVSHGIPQNEAGKVLNTFV